jgi:hypothetical protein
MQSRAALLTFSLRDAATFTSALRITGRVSGKPSRRPQPGAAALLFSAARHAFPHANLAQATIKGRRCSISFER